MKPQVAIVIPVGGIDAALERQLRTVSEQQLSVPFEVVLSLNTPEPTADSAMQDLLRRHGDGRVRSVSSADRRGASHARNVGVTATEAEYVLFCDADDVTHPGWAQALFDALHGHAVVGGHTNDVAPKGSQRWRPPTTPGGLPAFLGVAYPASGNLGVRREVFEELGGFDESLLRCEDIALGWRAKDAGYEVAYVPAAILDYHHRSSFARMLRQHFFYGIGMSQVLVRYGVPGASGPTPSRLSLMKPNRQPAPRSLATFARRGAMALGRLTGLVLIRCGRLRGSSPQGF